MTSPSLSFLLAFMIQASHVACSSTVRGVSSQSKSDDSSNPKGDTRFKKVTFISIISGNSFWENKKKCYGIPGLNIVGFELLRASACIRK